MDSSMCNSSAEDDVSIPVEGNQVPLSLERCPARRRPKKILEALGERATAFTRFVIKKARKVPILGSHIGCAEDVLSSWLEPLVTHIEKDGLYVLSFLDTQIHRASDVAVAHVPFASGIVPQLQTLLSGEPLDAVPCALEKLRTRGVVGSTADVWVEYEPIVKSNAQVVYNLANRVPLLNIWVLILRDIFSPVLAWASDWLVSHGEIKDKHEISVSQADFSSSPVAVAVTVTAANQDDTTPTDEKEDRSHPDPIESDGAADESSSTEENDANTAKVKEGDGAEGGKGEIPELSVAHEDDEQDELSDLFDSWGTGGAAKKPNRFNYLRTKSLNDSDLKRSPERKIPARSVTDVSRKRSFRF